MGFEREQITVEDPLTDNKWEYMRYQDHAFNREVFNIEVANGKVTWQEQNTYWDNDVSSEVEASLKETLAMLQLKGKLARTIEEDTIAEEAFGNLAAILTVKTRIIDREANLADCEFFYLEPLVGCGSNCGLSFGGCQCHK